MFTPASLAFLRGLARHNNKPWFEAHRESYGNDVGAPMRALIDELDVRLARLAIGALRWVGRRRDAQADAAGVRRGSSRGEVAGVPILHDRSPLDRQAGPGSGLGHSARRRLHVDDAAGALAESGAGTQAGDS